jgi:hypothetical protein
VKETADDPQDESKEQAYKDHRGDGYINRKIFFFDPDIPREISQPRKLVTPEPHHNPGNDQNRTNHDQYFSKARHVTRLSSRFKDHD